MKVKDCMCNHVNYVKPNTSVQDCAKMMCECHIGCTPVCDDSNRLVGIVTDRDILLRTVCSNKNAKTTPVSEIMTTDVCCCDSNEQTPNCEITEAERLMSEKQIRRIPVTQNNKVIGILTLGDLAANQSVDQKELCDTIECICGTDQHNAE